MFNINATAAGAELVTAAAPSLRVRVARRLAPLSAMIAIVAALAGTAPHDAHAASNGYRFSDGTVVDMDILCFNHMGSWVGWETYSSRSGVWSRSQHSINGYWNNVGPWTSVPTGYVSASAEVTGAGYASWQTNVQFGKYINGDWVTTPWYKAEAFSSGLMSSTLRQLEPYRCWTIM
jgi:hypothetical protein